MDLVHPLHEKCSELQPSSVYRLGLFSVPLQRLAACARLGAFSADDFQRPGPKQLGPERLIGLGSEGAVLGVPSLSHRHGT